MEQSRRRQGDTMAPVMPPSVHFLPVPDLQHAVDRLRKLGDHGGDGHDDDDHRDRQFGGERPDVLHEQALAFHRPDRPKDKYGRLEVICVRSGDGK